MPRPARSRQFVHSEICVVHIVQRCVRRAFLAGIDPHSGKDYSFRREWIRRRLEALASAFGIDVLSYAIMNNHFHLVIRNRPDVVAAWSDHEVALRWLRLFPGRRLDDQLAEPTQSDVATLVNQPQRIESIRQHLSDISWFMRALSEPIARRANREDECTGRFWEGRFKAIRIVDEAALLVCAAYVDLNPVRAAIATGPEESQHTSAYDRYRGERGETIDAAAFDLRLMSVEQAGQAIRETPVEKLAKQVQAKRRRPTGRRIRRDAWLAPLRLEPQVLSNEPQVHQAGVRASDKGFLQIGWKDYWELLRWTASKAADCVSSKLPAHLGALLSSRRIEVSQWRELVWNFQRYFGRAICFGTPDSMAASAQSQGLHWHRGQRVARDFFATA